MGDTNLYLSRKNQLLTLQVEHRFAAPPAPMQLKLCTEPAVHLSIVDNNIQNYSDAATNIHNLNPLQQQLLEILSTDKPLTTVTLRTRLRRRKQHVSAALNQLKEQKRIFRGPTGWCLTNDPSDHQKQAVPCSPPGRSDPRNTKK